MWQKLAQWLLLPLLREGIAAFLSWLKSKYEAYKRNKELDEESRRMEDAETPEEIREAHRNREHL